MKTTLSAPSKTFLIGEYVALNGGPSLIINSNPRFELEVVAGTGRCEGIHPHSPAGLYIRGQATEFSDFDLFFKDPHSGKGGFGASGAQFALAYAWSQIAKKPVSQWSTLLGAKSAWQQFKSIINSSGTAPSSGADVAAQFTGELTLYASDPFRAERITWPFTDKGFYIIRTGQKIPTHEHLSSLGVFNTSQLRKYVEQASRALMEKNWEMFSQAVGGFFHQQLNDKLVAEHSRTLVEKLGAIDGVDAVKGCGALGVDTIVLFFDLKQAAAIHQRVLDQGLEVVADVGDISNGVGVRVDQYAETTPMVERGL